MTDLLKPLNESQQFLVSEIASVYMEHAQWPVWEYLENEMAKRRFAPEATLRSLPVVGDSRPSGLRYGLIWTDRPTATSIMADTRVKLTVAGYIHAPGMHGRAQFFVRLLRLLVQRRQNTEFSPVSQTVVTITKDDIQREFSSISDGLLASLPDMMDTEPPTLRGGQSLPGGEWQRELTRELVDYADIVDPKAYFAQVCELLSPPEPSTIPQSVPTPLDLVASIDYFNTVWQLRFDKPIVRLFNAERIARLAFPVDSSDEFAAQLSSLSELLKISRFSATRPLIKRHSRDCGQSSQK